ncbi:MAG: cytochrome c family protein [Acidobacteriia bacterium]|nr:cytochrome c family protein [Terriglobia bacterium]
MMRPFGGFLSRIANSTRSRVLLAFVVCFLLTDLLAIVVGAGRTVRQPIAFNHSKHVESGAACPDCHTGVQTKAHATLPDLAVCMGCHETPLSQSPEEAKIRTIAAAGQKVAWTQLTRVPAHVYFSHRRHVQIAQLDCTECHGPVAKSTTPPTAEFRPATMDNCLACHAKRGVQTDCNDCHR